MSVSKVGSHDGELDGEYSPEVPLLFLDWDGVLNSGQWYEERSERGAEASVPAAIRDAVYGLGMSSREVWETDPKTLPRLRRILDETDCRIVWSSTWRYLYPWRHLGQFLQLLCGGIRSERFIGRTPHLIAAHNGGLWVSSDRGDEVMAWRREFGHIGPFACLDDTEDFSACESHLVRTLWHHGLTDDDTEDVIRRLQ